MLVQSRPFFLAAAPFALLALLSGAASAQNGVAPGRITVSDPVLSGVPLARRPFTLSVRLQNQAEQAVPAPAVDLVVPTDVLLDPPDALTGNVAPGAIVNRRWTLTPERPGLYAVQLRVRGEGEAERTINIPVSVAQEPENLDTRGDRHPHVKAGPDGSYVFRNESLVAVLQRSGDGYGPLLVYPATRTSTTRSYPVGFVPFLAQLGTENGGVFLPSDVRVSGDDRLKLRGTAGGAPVEAELHITDDPWLTWEVTARGGSGTLRGMPLQALGGGPRQFLFPGVAFGDGPEPAALVSPDPLRVTMPLMAVSRYDYTLAMLWDRPAEGQPAIRATFGGDDLGDAALRMELSTAAGGTANAPSRLAGRILVLPFESNVVAAVRQWGRAFQPPIIRGYPRSLEAARRLATSAYTGPLWNEQFGGWSPALDADKPLPPLQDAFPVLALMMEAGLSGGKTRADLRARADRVLAELRKAGPLDPILAYRAGGVISSLEAERRRLQPILDDQLANGAWTWESLFPPTPKDREPLGQPGEISLGVVAARALPLLRYASWTGDSSAAGAGRKALEYIGRSYRIPRGAQTFGFPLQTPSLMAASDAAECFLLGYQMSGEQRYMDRARYWADAGLAFVYAWSDRARPALLGASRLAFTDSDTSPAARQWAGLNFARVLRELSEVRPDGVYDFYSEALVASALHQQFASGPRAGLIPESWNLSESRPEGLALAPRPLLEALYPLQDLNIQPGHVRVRTGGDRMFAASGATLYRAWTSSTRLRLNLRWVEGAPAFLTLTGVADKPLSVQYNSSSLRSFGIPVSRNFLPESQTEGEDGWNYDPQTGLLIMRLRHTGGEDHLEIRWPDPKDRTPIDRVDTKVRGNR